MVTRPELPIGVILLLQTWGPPSELVVQMLQLVLTLRGHGSSTCLQCLFFSPEVSWQFCWYWLSGDADKRSAFSRAWNVPRSSAERALCGNVHVFFSPKWHLSTGVGTRFLRKIKQMAKDYIVVWGLWPFERILFKETSRKDPNRKSSFELPSAKGALSSRMVRHLVSLTMNISKF